MAILDDVKNYLDITWQDDATDQKIRGIISRGEAYLDRLTGETNDYESEGNARALLFDYVRYAQANALDDFEKNYVRELAQLRLDAQLDRAITASEAETDA